MASQTRPGVIFVNLHFGFAWGIWFSPTEARMGVGF